MRSQNICDMYDIANIVVSRWPVASGVIMTVTMYIDLMFRMFIVLARLVSGRGILVVSSHVCTS